MLTKMSVSGETTKPDSGEEITNTNPININIVDKSPEFTCYKLLWLNIRNRWEKRSLFTRRDLSLSIKIDFNLDGQKRNPLFTFQFSKLEWYISPDGH